MCHHVRVSVAPILSRVSFRLIIRLHDERKIISSHKDCVRLFLKLIPNRNRPATASFGCVDETISREINNCRKRQFEHWNRVHTLLERTSTGKSFFFFYSRQFFNVLSDPFFDKVLYQLESEQFSIISFFQSYF